MGIHRAEAAQRAFSLDRPNDDPKKEVASLHQIGVGLLEAGLVDEAESANDRTIRICQERGLTQSRRYAAALDVRARIAATRGEIDAARRHYAEALALMKSLGDEHEAILIRINMGELEYRAGRFARALEFADAALAAARRVHSRHREITALANLAAYRIALSDIEGARSSAREALVLSQWAPPLEISAAIQHLATVAALSGDCAGAARLCGYVDAWYNSEGCTRELTERHGYDILMKTLRTALRDSEIAALAAQGAAFSEEHAVAQALAV
ncbi:MAG: tetratricopeptide repeat protein [Candidatus Eremiobacteraeota bacterium]|nr:tetratricopeptide repeat protein [Candidatus Eremiobacteraeota bacterium]